MQAVGFSSPLLITCLCASVCARVIVCGEGVGVTHSG